MAKKTQEAPAPTLPQVKKEPITEKKAKPDVNVPPPVVNKARKSSPPIKEDAVTVTAPPVKEEVKNTETEKKPEPKKRAPKKKPSVGVESSIVKQEKITKEAPEIEKIKALGYADLKSRNITKADFIKKFIQKFNNEPDFHEIDDKLYDKFLEFSWTNRNLYGGYSSQESMVHSDSNSGSVSKTVKKSAKKSVKKGNKNVKSKLNAYSIFCDEQRALHKVGDNYINPETKEKLSFGDLNVRLGALWGKLKDEKPEEYKKYKDLQAKDEVRWNQEIEARRLSNPEDQKEENRYWYGN
jgi:hypothetical protein